MMTNKIDPLLSKHIKTLGLKDDLIDCVVYSNNFGICKKKIISILGKNDDNKIDNMVELPFMSAFGLRLKPYQISLISNFSYVNYITSSLKVQTQIDVTKKVIKLSNIDSNISSDITCAIIDTGISPIIDLTIPKYRIIKFVDFVNSKETPYDDNGHGTFVASILAGNGLVSNHKYSGICPNCNLIGIKALDSNGETGVINILKSMQWVLDNKQKYNIRVVCMSFGSMVLSNNDPLVEGVEVMWNNGITVVAAAGNSGPEMSTIKSPGASHKIITVGALNDKRDINGDYNIANFEIADFSSRGPILGNFKPDLVVPGVNITGACNYNLLKLHYSTMSGTSVATPIVAGVCCLLLSVNPRLSPNSIKKLLINNTFQLNFDRNAEGFGILDCSRLLR